MIYKIIFWRLWILVNLSRRDCDSLNPLKTGDLLVSPLRFTFPNDCPNQLAAGDQLMIGVSLLSELLGSFQMICYFLKFLACIHVIFYFWSLELGQGAIVEVL